MTDRPNSEPSNEKPEPATAPPKGKLNAGQLLELPRRHNRRGRAWSDEAISTMVAESLYFPSVAEVAKKWGIGARTLTRYRSMALTDPALAQLVEQKKALLGVSWRDSAVLAIREAFETLRQQALSVRPKDGEKATPQEIRSMAGMAKILTDAHITSGVMEHPALEDNGQQRSGGDPSSRAA